MVIWLSEKDRIAAIDGATFQLQRQRHREDGREVWDIVGYYGTLNQAATAALNRAIARTDWTPKYRQLLKAIEQATDRISVACEGALSAMAAAEFDGAHVPVDLPADVFEVTFEEA